MSNEEFKENAGSRILTSVASIFAEKGFDGVRVIEIVKMAGVPKLLIYTILFT